MSDLCTICVRRAAIKLHTSEIDPWSAGIESRNKELLGVRKANLGEWSSNVGAEDRITA